MYFNQINKIKLQDEYYKPIEYKTPFHFPPGGKGKSTPYLGESPIISGGTVFLLPPWGKVGKGV
jgi:hypothetical protein